MSESRSYDPLTVEELGQNAARALMSYPAVPLPPETASGTGVYTLHYRGAFELYEDVGEELIYVGQARNLASRLGQHARSIGAAGNLELADFECRWLVLAPVWISLTEQILINEYRPVWNAIRGFGNHDQGSTRRAQQRSQWDTLHPGRAWAESYQELDGGREGVLAAIRQQRKERR